MNVLNKRKLDNELEIIKSPKIMKTSNGCDNLLDGIDFGEFDDADFSMMEPNVEKTTNRNDFLDLTSWKRCTISDCHFNGQLNALIIQGSEDVPRSSKQSMSSACKPMACHLQSIWAQCKIAAGDIVSLFAVWNEERQSFCVTLNEGFCVVRPDLLVSGTTVVSGLFCMRKAILSDRFKGIEAAMKIMTVGSIIHELFQIALRQRLTTRAQIKAASEKMLQNPEMSYTLYASSMTSTEARKEFDGFLDKVHWFMQRYIEGVPQPTDKKTVDFAGKIDDICDIEENIWIPKLGLKGKIDVSVKVKRQQNAALHYMPLELKTGKASFSSEHTGQLIIYQMMMSEMEQNPINSGLLLYLREGVMREINGKHGERRDLIILRNEISYYLSTQADLPEPINRANVCTQCPYNVLCSLYLSQNNEMLNELDSKHPMREIGPAVTSHLSEAHIEYFCHWVGLMTLENQENRKVNPMKSMWLETPEHREFNGMAVTNLALSRDVIAEAADEYVHEFNSSEKDLTSYNFTIGSYLIVSTSKRFAVAAGRCISVAENAIKLVLERNLCDRYDRDTFTIDKYESQANSTFNMSNLGALLDDTDSSSFLRKVVIDRVRPTFTKSLPKVITTTGKQILMPLNSDQRSAVLKALTANEYLLLKGLPGTGKTQTLAALIRLLVLTKQSVLVTSHTHSAVDNVLVRLKKSDPALKFLRLGSSSRIRAELGEHSEAFYTNNCTSADELASIYEQFDVVGVTCLGSGHPLLTQRKFDVCLVDESTQVLQSTVLRPLFSAKKIILVGDPDQLPPIVRSLAARELGADESLFARLDLPDATATLSLQYRMNRVITKLANDLTYNGALKCADENIATATLQLKSSSKLKWIQRTLSSHIDQSVIFLNTSNVYKLNQQFIDGMCQSSKSTIQSPTKLKNSRIYSNYYEAAIVLHIIKELKAMNVDSKMIGIIAPYALQVDLLRKSVQQLYDADIEVNTVDQYQGRDKEVIIYSCTQSKDLTRKIKMQSADSNKCNEILEDQRRLTVAITRAKHKFIMIGDMVSLESYGPFKRLLYKMNEMSKIHLIDQQQGFHWEHLLSVFGSLHTPIK